MKREDLIRSLGLVKPALATQPYVPALLHFALDGQNIMAYNDAQGIRVAYATGLDCAVPGELLVKALNSLPVDDVMISLLDSKEFLLSGGRSRLKIPTLPRSDFETVFKFPVGKDLSQQATNTLEVSAKMMEGIRRCLTSVGTDPTHPAQMGVTLHARTTGGAAAFLYSTDNFSASRFMLKELKTSENFPEFTILPTPFCENLMRLADAFSEEKILLWFMTGAVTATLGQRAQLFSKLLVDVDPLDFTRLFSKNYNDAIKRVTIPGGTTEAFERALLVLANDDDKVTRATVEGKRLHLNTTSQMGQVNTSLLLDEEVGDVDFKIDPVLVARASKLADKMGFSDSTMVFSGGDDFSHMVTHYAK